jgi:hypothetical protein
MGAFALLRYKHVAAGGGGAFSLASSPSLAGDYVVGQRAYATQGTYSQAPDSITWQWKLDGNVLSDELGDNILLYDIYQGSIPSYVETASKAGYSDVVTTVVGSAIALIDATPGVLTNAITAFSRTSASGDNTPTLGLDFSITFGSNVRAGYMLRLETFSNGALLDAAHRIQDIRHQLTNDDLQSGASLTSALVAAGMTKMGALEWLRPTVYTTSPNGPGYEFVSDTLLISPTNQTIPMVFSSTNIYQALIVGGTSNLTAQGNAGSGIRAALVNRPLASTGKYYIEFNCPNGSIAVCLYDASADITKNVFDEQFGGTANAHAAGYLSSGLTDFNGSSTSGLTAEVAGDGVDVAIDQDNHKVWWRVASGDGATAGSWLPSGNPATNTGGVNISTMTGNVTPGVQFGANGAQATIRASSFIRTPPSGFVAP